MRLDLETFKIYMKFLAENAGEEVSEAKSAIYFEMLGDLETTEFKKGIKTLMQTRVYKSLPQIAEIREACLGNKSDMALMAWSKVYDAIGSYGRNRSISFQDKTIHMAIESIGGWQRLCNTTVSQLEFLKKDFMKGYEAFLRQPMPTKAYFLGYHDDVDILFKIPSVACDYLPKSREKALLQYVGEMSNSKNILENFSQRNNKTVTKRGVA